MDLSEHRTQHPNLIKSANHVECVVGLQTYTRSIIIPYNEAISETVITQVQELGHEHIEQLCSLQPEIIILGTGAAIEFPHTDLLHPLVEKNIGLEVLNNQAAARTFNVLLSEDRNVVCLMLLD